SLIGELRDALTPYRDGPCPLQVAYINGRAAATLALGDAWRIHPDDALLARLRGLEGIDRVDVVYA
ncbi:MAG: hypothetical protein H0V34_07535, partial [Gammaproteobacteria bacterium]|nr:hypothetical protein [Gammaproteobacteria bacterium]